MGTPPAGQSRTKSTARSSRKRPEAVDLDVVVAGLEPDATASERVRAMTALGFTVAELAQTLRVSEGAVRGWRDDRHAPTGRLEQGLDDLRYVLRFLVREGAEPARLASWFRSACDDLSEGATEPRRPLDVIGKDPVLVLGAAAGYVQRRAPKSDSLVRHLQGSRKRAAQASS